MQYHHDRVPRDAKQLTVGVARGDESVELPLTLPRYWWRTDLSYRYWSIDPSVFFTAEPLSEGDKRARQIVGLDNSR